MKRKLFAVLVTVLLSFVLLPQMASATYSGECGKNLTWELVGGNTLVISGTGEMYDYIYTTYKSDSTKQAPWRKYADAIIRIELEEGVSNIPGGAFCELYNLKSISLPESLKTIEGGAFTHCFRLETIEIPAGTTQIGDPPIHFIVGYRPFGACGDLDGIWVNENNPNYCNDEFGVLFNKDKTELLAVPGQISGEYQIPDGVKVAQYHIPDMLGKILVPPSVEVLYEDGRSIPKTDPVFEGYAVDENNPNFSNDKFGVLFDKEKKHLLSIPVKMPAYYIVPDTVTTIDHNSNFGHSLVGIQFPVSLTYLDISGLNFSSIKEIYYEGTEEQWNSVKFSPVNVPLNEDIIIRFNTTIPEELLREPEETTEPTEETMETLLLRKNAVSEPEEEFVESAEAVSQESKSNDNAPKVSLGIFTIIVGILSATGYFIYMEKKRQKE